jgi:hypothetical protein
MRFFRVILLIVIFVHFVAKLICVEIKFPKEMPKIAKCLNCLKLRYSIDFIKRKKQGMRLYSFADCLFFMLKIPGVYNKDGATRGASACAARATPQF